MKIVDKQVQDTPTPARLTEEQCRQVEENLNLVWGALIRFQIRERMGSFMEEDDIVQVARLVLCNAIMRYRPGKSTLSTYVYRAIDNAFIDELRRHWKKSRIENKLEVCNYEDKSLDIDNALEGAKLRMAGVSIQGIDMLKMRLAGYDTNEIAEVYGIPSSTVNRRILIAKRKLRQDSEFLHEVGIVDAGCCSAIHAPKKQSAKKKRKN